MISVPREMARIRRPALAVSALTWGALAIRPEMHLSGLDAYCSSTGGGAAAAAASLSMLLALAHPSALAAGWALMLVAMMSPVLVPGIHHVRFTSFARRRARSVALFAAGYGALWMLWGAALTGAALLARILLPAPYLFAVATGLVACVWQASPFKQRCLNRCHDAPPLRAFGWEADLDAFRFGCTHGLWCAGSCSALMLFLMSFQTFHLAAMAAVAALIFCERLENVEPPRWKMRGLGRARRAIVAQLRIRWRMSRVGTGPSPRHPRDPRPPVPWRAPPAAEAEPACRTA